MIYRVHDSYTGLEKRMIHYTNGDRRLDSEKATIRAADALIEMSRRNFSETHNGPRFGPGRRRRYRPLTAILGS